MSTFELRRDKIIKRSIAARNDYIQRLWRNTGIRTKKHRRNESENDNDTLLSNIYHAQMFRPTLPYKNHRPSIKVFEFDQEI
jgi:hypothetical protein